MRIFEAIIAVITVISIHAYQKLNFINRKMTIMKRSMTMNVNTIVNVYDTDKAVATTLCQDFIHHGDIYDQIMYTMMNSYST